METDPLLNAAREVVATALLSAVLMLAHTHPVEAMRYAAEHDRLRAAVTAAGSPSPDPTP